MEPPPTRYKVIEKDGRLFVLDRGEPVETLIHHAHPVVTPDRMRARTQSSPIGARRAKGPPRAARDASSAPVAAIAGTPNAANGGKLLGRLAMSFVALVFLLVVFWWLFVPLLVVAWIALAFVGTKEDPGYKKVFRAWSRWLNG